MRSCLIDVAFAGLEAGKYLLPAVNVASALILSPYLAMATFHKYQSDICAMHEYFSRPAAGYNIQDSPASCQGGELKIRWRTPQAKSFELVES